MAPLLVLLFVATLKVGQQLYSYYVFRDERRTIATLEQVIDTVGLGIIETQLLADSLRNVVEEMDARLQELRRDLDRDESLLLGFGTTRGAEQSYLAKIEEYNRLAAERNMKYEEWRGAVARNHAFVDRYNSIVDSIRAAATAMGEPYYPVPTPAEIAASHEERGSGAPPRAGASAP